MEPLKLLDTDRDVLRSVLEDEDSPWEANWEFYDHEDADQDSTFSAAIRRLDDWLGAHQVNGGDSIDFTLVADLDGQIEGYEFQYRTRIGDHVGDHALDLNAGFRDWGDVRGDHDGIEGVIDFLLVVLHTINWTISETNGWMTARASV
jgi:hypothetical protein